jgi:hypothetical protein
VCRSADQQTVDEIQDTDDLFAFGELRGGRQFLNQCKVKRDRGATGLHKRPSIAHKIHAIFDSKLRQRFEQ